MPKTNSFYQIMIGFPVSKLGRLYHYRKCAEKNRKKLEEQMPDEVIWIISGFRVKFKWEAESIKI